MALTMRKRMALQKIQEGMSLIKNGIKIISNDIPNSEETLNVMNDIETLMKKEIERLEDE